MPSSLSATGWNSKRGVRFRQWATRVLREHLTEEYSLNAIRLAERGLDEARQAIDLLATLADPASSATPDASSSTP